MHAFVLRAFEVELWSTVSRLIHLQTKRNSGPWVSRQTCHRLVLASDADALARLTVQRSGELGQTSRRTLGTLRGNGGRVALLEADIWTM